MVMLDAEEVIKVIANEAILTGPFGMTSNATVYTLRGNILREIARLAKKKSLETGEPFKMPYLEGCWLPCTFKSDEVPYAYQMCCSVCGHVVQVHELGKPAVLSDEDLKSLPAFCPSCNAWMNIQQQIKLIKKE